MALKILILISLNLFTSCQKPVTQSFIPCENYRSFKKESDFMESKHGIVESITLKIEDPQNDKAQSIVLKMNKKPQARIQTLHLENASELPLDWRKLAGLSPQEVQDFFVKHYRILGSSLTFVEYAGFGGKKILWNSITGSHECIQK